jgi:hypothetical protein
VVQISGADHCIHSFGAAPFEIFGKYQSFGIFSNSGSLGCSQKPPDLLIGGAILSASIHRHIPHCHLPGTDLWYDHVYYSIFLSTKL